MPTVPGAGGRGIPVFLGRSVLQKYGTHSDGDGAAAQTSFTSKDVVLLRFLSHPRDPDTLLDGAKLKTTPGSSSVAIKGKQHVVVDDDDGRSSPVPARKKSKVVYEGIADKDAASDSKNFVLVFDADRECYFLEKPDLVVQSLKQKLQRSSSSSSRGSSVSMALSPSSPKSSATGPTKNPRNDSKSKSPRATASNIGGDANAARVVGTGRNSTRATSKPLSSASGSGIQLITPALVKKMKVAEVREHLSRLEVSFPARGVKKAALVDLLLAAIGSGTQVSATK